MTTIRKALWGSVAIGGAVLWPAVAAAQIDVNPPLPNLMLLIDTSGSMEYMADGTMPACTNPLPPGASPNRWGTLVNVLTGSVKNPGCYAQDRNSTAFKAEFGLGGDPPYDGSYFLPHHRIVSNDCVAGPGNLPLQVYDWPAGAIAYHKYDDKDVSCNVAFDQSKDGLLDVYRDRVRFGMMTFDPSANAGTGIMGNAADYGSGMAGLWSYYLDWQTGGTPAQGHPPNCNLSLFEVGARNSAAPPWEGRMISFGHSDASLADIQQSNSHIQDALLTMRPYGATPLAGMMADAFTYFRQDSSKDPLDSAYYFGPHKDPLFNGGCRSSFILVLSDGEPNLDLRPFCQNGNGTCPFQHPWEIAGDLANPSNPNDAVPTYAVGFGLSQDAGVDCNTLNMPADLQSGGLCDGATGSLAACCTLSHLAYEGGTQRAYFADDLATLKTKLQGIIDSVAGGSTSRTMPAMAGASSTQVGTDQGNPPPVSYEFTTSFEPGVGELWSGNLERHRWVCDTINGSLTAVLQSVDQSKGDDFAANVNQGKLTKPRTFYTVVGQSSSQNGNPFIDSEATIRPGLSQDDGLGLYGGSTETGTNSSMAGVMQGKPAAMGLFPMPAACAQQNLQAANEAQCAYRVMFWELGGINGGGLPSRSGNEFGAIYHATPSTIGAPRGFIRDQSYELFSNQKATRALMLYTATTDGQLHAFKVASNDPNDTGVKAGKLENNELWSFLPPHVLPNLIGQYPSVQQILLDGAPIVKDVVFERSLAQAKVAGTNAGAPWRTVLVASGRAGGGFYYALDVTDPTQPEFLWQLSYTRDGATKQPLFGDMGGTPAIATITLKSGSNVKEVAVAVLPGGPGTVTSPTCQHTRNNTNFAHIDSTYKPRSNVRCWQDGPSRSLTIVRLKDGKVLRSFRGVSADGPSKLDSGLVKVVGFDSPISGSPVAYPSQVGQVADRVYVGDADGGLWRIDVASPDPAKWDARLAFDAYPLASDNYDDGQSLELPPVVGVDGEGNTVVIFATGEQETFYATAQMKTRVWSILDRPEQVGLVPFKVEANWLIPFEDGKRVTGPIALFDEVAYFATFTPQSSAVDACTDGFGSIWGVDYLQSQASVTGPRPLPRLPVDPNANPIVYIDEDPQSAGTVVFGVAVTQEPACYDTATVTDDYVGSFTAITEAVPPKFVLKYHTGQKGTAQIGSKTNTATRALPAPKQTTRIDSWASVVE